jgi:peptide/nickel transport system permease protein
MTSDATTTNPPAGGESAAPPGAGRSLWGDAARTLARDRVAVLCFAVIILYILIALAGWGYEFLADWNSEDQWVPFSQMGNTDQANLPPDLGRGPWYWLGTDWYGRSVLVKTLLGVKVSITVGMMANIIAVPLGMVLGAVAGYYGRWLDSSIVWLFTTLSSVPGIIRLIALRYAFQDLDQFGLDGLPGLVIALAVTSWIGTCRLVRAEVFKIRELDYVLAARAIGTPGPIILFRHVLRNVLHLGIINFSLGFVGAVKAEVILSYLGLGVKVGTPSWGSMINAARDGLVLTGRWWELTSAVVAMFLLVLALNLFGDRLRDALDPRLRGV